jgi:SAM-dependent methyltransferase
VTLAQRIDRRLVRYAPPGIDNPSHPERTEWMLGHIPRSARVVEVGCGTGWHVTLPLLQAGVDIRGSDLDEASIAHGRRAFQREGADPGALSACDVRDLPGSFDVVIASELFEHLDDDELAEMLEIVRGRLTDGGLLLVTVPNGYGWFELDAFLWHRARLGRLVQLTRLGSIIRRLKTLVVSGATHAREPNTLSSCPHARRFTLRDLQGRLRRAGFEVEDARGSVMFCGPFTNLVFGGARRVQRVNARLARRLPGFASGFYVAARVHDGR